MVFRQREASNDGRKTKQYPDDIVARYIVARYTGPHEYAIGISQSSRHDPFNGMRVHFGTSPSAPLIA